MTEGAPVIKIDGSVERCTGVARWVLKPPHMMTLQQAWEVVMYRDGQPWKARMEWRDVPTIDSTEK